SPHVVQILDVEVTEDGLPFFAMDLLDGNDLETELRIRGALPVDEAVHYIRQACIALDEAQRAGLAHHGIKPSNLFLCEGGGRRNVRLLDFGCTRVLDEVEGRLASPFAALYFAPEQVLKRE